jgi:hypothetical protein
VDYGELAHLKLLRKFLQIGVVREFELGDRPPYRCGSVLVEILRSDNATSRQVVIASHSGNVVLS